MKVGIIGSGGREHSLCEALNKSKKITKIYCFPGNAGTQQIAENININTPMISSKEQIINKALSLHSQGNIKEAQKSYQDIINQGIKDHRIFSNYGVILNQIGNTKEAEILYRKAIKLKPDFADAYLNLGCILKVLNNTDEAEKYLKRAVELMPEDPIVNDHYGDILWKLNRKIQARYFWNNVLKFDDTEDSMRNKINIKVIEGLKNS